MNESNYVGDGFTEEYDDGWPMDAHPDEVDYDNLRTTYPDLPEYHELDKDEQPKLDEEFLKYFTRLAHILNTTGWATKRHLRARVKNAIQTLDDNGYDMPVTFILKGAGVSRDNLY